MIECKEDRYFLGVWYIEAFPNGNTLLTAYKDKNGHWEGRARIRTYNDSKAFDSEDKKTAYPAYRFTDHTDEQTEETMFKMMQILAEKIAKHSPDLENNKISYVPLRSNDPTKIMFELAKQPWYQMKEEPI